MKKQKTTVKARTKVKRKPRKQKSNKLFIVSSSCVGALVAVALLVNYQKSEETLFEEIAFQESDTNLLVTDTGEGSLVVISDSVDELTTTLVDGPKVASAFKGPGVFAFNDGEISEAQATSADEVSYQDAHSYSKPVQNFSSCFEIGADYTYVDLKPHGDASFHGNLGGLQASYAYKPKNNVYVEANFSWKEGNLHGSTGKRSLLYIDAQERLGYTLASKSLDYTCTIFSGLGYRHFGQKLTPNVGGTSKLRYNEFYIPVGILSDYTFNSWFAMGLDFTWMPEVYPTVSSSALKGSRWTLTNRLDNFYVNLPMSFTLTKSKRFHVVVDPFYERWQDGHFTAETLSGAGNTYNFWGVNLNMSYSF